MKRTDLSHVEVQDSTSYYWGSFRRFALVAVASRGTLSRFKGLPVTWGPSLMGWCSAQSSTCSKQSTPRLPGKYPIPSHLSISPHAPDTLKKLNRVSHYSRVKRKTWRIVCVSVRLSTLPSAAAAVTPTEQFSPPNFISQLFWPHTTGLVQMWRTWCFRGRKVAGSIPIVHTSLTGDSDVWVLITVCLSVALQ